MTGSALVLRANALRLPLPDESVDLIVTSPPYFALRSYRDMAYAVGPDGKVIAEQVHYAGQIGSEPTPQAFLEALWAVMAECWRVLKPTGSCFVNLGDKRSGSGGHNNAGISAKSTLRGNGHVGGVGKAGPQKIKATLRNAPDRYNQAAFGRAKSKMLLPHRFAEGCMDGIASPCGCPVLDGYRCPPGMHRADLTCVLHGRCRTPWIMRQDVVWQKLNGLPESVTDRCRDSHEYLFHFTKEGRYFAAVDEVREVYADARQEATGRTWEERKANGERSGNREPGSFTLTGHAGTLGVANPLGKLPGSVWALPSEPLIISDEVKAHYDLPDHFAAFPTELVRRVILGWSPSGICVECGDGRRPVVAKENVLDHASPNHRPAFRDGAEPDGNSRGLNGSGGVYRTEATVTGYACRCGTPAPPTRPAVVLDPFLGSGTTTMVARALGRIGVGTDLSADYCRLAQWRTFRSGGGAKALNRTNRENQCDLFGVPA